MESYMSVSEAAAVLQVEPDVVLNKLVKSGMIRTIMLSATGQLLVNVSDLRSAAGISGQPEYARFSHLAGQTISLSEASRRYAVGQTTISRWVKSGLLRRMGTHGRQVLVDEAEVATACHIFTAGGSQGKWIFKGGRVYVRKQ